jgi:aminoglycoside phosphotransferase (APT) family kinase protein
MGERSRQIVSEVLQAALADLQTRLVPTLTDPDAQLVATMLSDLIEILAAWHQEPAEDLVARMAPLADLCGADSPPSASDDPGGLDAYGNLAHELQNRIETSGQTDLSALQAALRADRAFYKGEMDIRRNAASRGFARIAAVEVEMTAERAGRLTTACLGEGFSVERLARLPGGMSKDSFYLTLRTPEGGPMEVVVRRDLPFGPALTTVKDEYALLTKLIGRGLPMAAPLGCDATGLAGQPAMLSERVAGSSGSQAWREDPAARMRVCLQLAEAMAKLHRIDPTDVDLKAAADPRSQVEAYVLCWRERWRSNRQEPSPTLAAAFDWLLANLPQEVDRASIVHGDIGFHNIIVDGDRVRALLDWEFFHVGDPVEDLSYVRQFIDPLMPWSGFIAAYRAAGGVEYRTENAAFYEVWRDLRNSITCATAWRGFLEGRYPALKMAYQGMALSRYFTQQLAKTLGEKIGCVFPT